MKQKFLSELYKRFLDHRTAKKEQGMEKWFPLFSLTYYSSLAARSKGCCTLPPAFCTPFLPVLPILYLFSIASSTNKV